MLIKEHRNAVSLAKKLGIEEGQLSQWKNRSIDSKTQKPRSISSESARFIESKTGKPRGWMDQPVVDETQKFLDALETIRSTPKEKVAEIRGEFRQGGDIEINKKESNNKK